MYTEKPNTIYHVGVSGGKDSVAALLFLVEKVAKEKIRATFCNTVNEHEWTYEHIRLVSDRVHPIEELMPKRGFDELALHKHRFPSTKARFCTQFLKIFPSRDYIDGLQAVGHDVVAVSGVRADESEERKSLPEWDSWMAGALPCVQWRPLIRWKLTDILALHLRHNVPLNPLYAAGAQRVGCFPCIMSRKAEIRNIALNFPARIDHIRELEQRFEQVYGRYSSFFSANTVPLRFRSKRYVSKKGKVCMVATIDDVVRWSLTGDRARGSYEKTLFKTDGIGCMSGFCE